MNLYSHPYLVFLACSIQDIFQISGHFMGCFSRFFFLFVLLLRYIALSLFYIGHLCCQILDPVPEASSLRLSLTLFCHCTYSIGSENDSAYEFIFIVKCPHCRQPHVTLWAIFFREISVKNRRNCVKVGNSAETQVWLFNAPWGSYVPFPGIIPWI